MDAYAINFYVPFYIYYRLVLTFMSKINDKDSAHVSYIQIVDIVHNKYTSHVSHFDSRSLVEELILANLHLDVYGFEPDYINDILINLCIDCCRTKKLRQIRLQRRRRKPIRFLLTLRYLQMFFSSSYLFSYNIFILCRSSFCLFCASKSVKQMLISSKSKERKLSAAQVVMSRIATEFSYGRLDSSMSEEELRKAEEARREAAEKAKNKKERKLALKMERKDKKRDTSIAHLENSTKNCGYVRPYPAE